MACTTTSSPKPIIAPPTEPQSEANQTASSNSTSDSKERNLEDNTDLRAHQDSSEPKWEPERELEREVQAKEPALEPVPLALDLPLEAFSKLRGWAELDKGAALRAFRRSCEVWAKRNPNKALHAQQDRFGTYGDWQPVCDMARLINVDNSVDSANFFEQSFLPVRLGGGSKKGMLTGYYQPEVEVRKQASLEFTEPVLAKPFFNEALSWSRHKINVATSPILAFGRPAEVFFMQIQGSGILRFEDGRKIRAAFAAHNGHEYTSIGRILIQRGEMTADEASKQTIEEWMERAGREEAKALMNQNARYIFFRLENLEPGIGPKGGMQVPLTDMASLAIDPAHYPYGVPIWLETKLPQHQGDYTGQQSELLLIAQDTGSAIRGAYRGDIYFGSGDWAGELAGIMKHPASWTILLPVHLALLNKKLS